MTPTYQASFARALLNGALPCPTGLRTHNGSDPAVRFAVYRNNVVTSLMDALAESFPVVRQLVGEEFFAAMARLFVARHPPRSPVLSEWGDGFAAFIADFEPAACLPYLPDVARLERARVRAFHAADAPRLDVGDIAALHANPAALDGTHVAFHPSAQIVDSRWAIVSLWAAHQAHGDIAQVDPSLPEAALVLRDENDDVAVIGLRAATAAFLGRLAKGQTLGQASHEAYAAGESTGAPFDLAASLGLLIRHRVLAARCDSQELRT